MKKSNWIVLAIAAAISGFLLWLWYNLGFNKVDNPLDLAMSIGWWCGIILLAWFIYRSEQKRRRQIRTIYVSPTALYNSERGVVECPDPSRRVSIMEDILEGLKYDFHKEEMPESGNFDYSYVVRTDDFEEKDSDAKSDATAKEPETVDVKPEMASDETTKLSSESEPKWIGSVIKLDRANGNVKSDFDGKQQLTAALG